MNKSNQIIEFISKNKKNIKIDLYRFDLIDTIIQIIKNTQKENLNFSYKINMIEKLHNKNYTLLYDFFKEYQMYVNNLTEYINTLNDFIKFYTANQHTFDLKKIKSDIQHNKELLKTYENIYENINRPEISELFFKNTFVSIDVLTELEINDLKHIKIDNNDFYLSLYYYNIDNIDKYLKNIIFIIKLIKNINKYFKYQDIKFNVVIFLGNCKKKISHKIITPLNMNSGTSIPTVYANVWRKEEYEKVLIHELLHFIKADFFNHDANALEKEIKKIFSYEISNSINESYNETLAGIINMCYKSVKYSINLNKIYQTELNFLYIQTAKLIDIFGGKTINDLFDKKITIRQTTSALSYIILKMILFHHILDTIDFIKKINLKCNTSSKIDLFNKFLINSIEKKSYVDNVDFYIDKLKSIHKNNKIKKTMRMSVI